MEQESRVYYDEEIDDLIISVKAENEKVRKNFMFDDFVISLTGKGKIVGIEIKNVSNLLNLCGIDSGVLKNPEKFRLLVLPKRDLIFIGIIVPVLEKKAIIRKTIPITHVPKQLCD